MLSPAAARRLCLAAATCAAALAVGPATAGDGTTTLGSGTSQVWIMRPPGPVRDIVVFAHGWSTPLPSQAFAPWIAHLRSRGSVVVYPALRECRDDEHHGGPRRLRSRREGGLP